VDDELRRLRDRLDVSDVVSRYAFAVDLEDWEALGAILTDEVHLELTHVATDSPLHTRDQFVALARSTVAGFDATHHLIPNRLVTIDGDRASCKAYAHAWHNIPTEPGVADYALVRGFYEFGLCRTEGGWLIDRMVVTIQGPPDGYMGVYEIARKRLEAADAAG
jgi:hypothetical protein